MTSAGLLRQITQPITGIALCTLVVTALPAVSFAAPPVNRGPVSVGGERNRVNLEESYTLGAGDRIQIDIFNV
ncbi:MAG TPA: hypothetical protein V6D03_03795, partial [Candidatus Caenarcaniphilales bacterium]